MQGFAALGPAGCGDTGIGEEKYGVVSTYILLSIMISMHAPLYYIAVIAMLC